MGGLVVMVIPRLESTGTKMKRALRTLTVVAKRVHHMARLNHQTYRIAFQLGKDQKQLYWVEVAANDVTLLSREQEEIQKKERKDDKDKKESFFQKDYSLFKTPQELPKGVYFQNVESATRRISVDNGIAYIHFMPQGLAEESAIHIGDRNTIEWTVTVHPLTGQADVSPGFSHVLSEGEK